MQLKAAHATHTTHTTHTTQATNKLTGKDKFQEILFENVW